jgi:dUTP diphosphatase
MTIKKIELISDDPNYIPKKATDGSCGYDLTAVDYEVDPFTRCVKYNTGVKVQLPKGYAGLLLPRSSIYKTGPWVMANSVGLIDTDYTGELKAVFRCTSDDWDINTPPYELGERICQLMIVPYTNVEWEQVEDFSTKTARGSGGFGSTNK